MSANASAPTGSPQVFHVLDITSSLNSTLNSTLSLNGSTPSSPSPHSYPMSPPPPTPFNGPDYSSSSFLLFGIIGATVTVLVGVCMLLTLAWRRYRHGRSETAATNVLRGQQQARLAALIAQSSGNNVMANQYLLVELVRMYGPAAMAAFDPHTGEFRGLSYLPQGASLQQQQQLAESQQGFPEQVALQPPPRVWDVHLIVEPDGTVGMATKLDESGEKVEGRRASECLQQRPSGALQAALRSSGEGAGGGGAVPPIADGGAGSGRLSGSPGGRSRTDPMETGPRSSRHSRRSGQIHSMGIARGPDAV